MVAHIAGRLLEPEEGRRFARDAVKWIEKTLGPTYLWPGNYREPEQCIRSLVLRGEYRPTASLKATGEDDWNAIIELGEVTAEEVLRRYTRHVHSRTGTVAATARRLD